MTISTHRINQVDPKLVVDFSRRTWGEDGAEDILSKWWIESERADTIVAFDEIKQRVAGIVVGIKSRWPLPDGSISDTVSICGWYVAPEYAGQGLGRLLVCWFDETTTSKNTLAISKDAVRGFQKLGWIGPFRSSLLLLPFPVFRRSPRPKAGFSLKSYDVYGDHLSDDLVSALEYIEQARPETQIRRLRPVAAWQSHLRVHPNRAQRFHVLFDGDVPIGAFVIRATDDGAGAIYRRARLHYVTDIVLNRYDKATLEFLAHSIGPLAPKSAGALLICTSDARISMALKKAGWLSEQSIGIGKYLAAKAPLYMLGGALAQVPGRDALFTFTDSDADLNI